MKSAGDRFELVLLVVTGVALAVTLFAYLQLQSEKQLRFAAPLVEIVIPTDPASIAEGGRQAKVRECFKCHGDELTGKLYFASVPKGIIVVAPNLTEKIREYSNAEFVRAVRHGVRPDGTSLEIAMPSFAFFNMSDADLGKIMAYLQSQPAQPGLEGGFRYMPAGWFRHMLLDTTPPVAAMIDHDAVRVPPGSATDAVAQGRYLAESMCTECHGSKGGLRSPASPELQIALAFSRDDFFRLLRTGVGLGGREIDPLMSQAVRKRYVSLSDAEVDALYAYFQSLGY